MWALSWDLFLENQNVTELVVHELTLSDEIQYLRFMGILCSQSISLIIWPQCLFTATSDYYN